LLFIGILLPSFSQRCFVVCPWLGTFNYCDHKTSHSLVVLCEQMFLIFCTNLRKGIISRVCRKCSLVICASLSLSRDVCKFEHYRVVIKEII